MTVLACDIGATRIKLGLIQQGKVQAQALIDSRSETGLATRLPEIAGTLRSLCERRGVELQDCLGVSLSVPSLVDPVSGRILAEYEYYALLLESFTQPVFARFQSGVIRSGAADAGEYPDLRRHHYLLAPAANRI